MIYTDFEFKTNYINILTQNLPPVNKKQAAIPFFEKIDKKTRSYSSNLTKVSALFT